jgi:hypothetical protein
MKTVLMKLFIMLAASFWVSEVGAFVLNGRVLGRDAVPAAAANVWLVSKQDSSVVKTALTDESGMFMMEGVPAGEFVVKASHMGYATFQKEINVHGDLNLPDILLQYRGNDLAEVKVTALKPLVERHFDKLVMNIENSILAAGNSAWDLLTKAPGVLADQNDQVTLKGKPGVVVMIDGKRSPLAGADLANYLRAMPSEMIAKIELISNPSARYDAQGAGGIIDIKLVKDKRNGSHGTLNLAYGQGRLPKTNNGIALNHKNGKFNVFGNYNYAYRENFSNLVLYRQFLEDAIFTGAYDQDNFIKYRQKSQIGRIGMDYKLTSRSDVGLVFNGSRLRLSPRGHNRSLVINAEREAISKFETLNRSEDNWHDWGVNLNFTHRFDSTGKELKLNLDYAQYGNETEQNFNTQTYTLAGQATGNPYLLHGDINGLLNIYAIKLDYVYPVRNIVSLESGVKSSYVHADNNLRFYDRTAGEAVFDSTKSNHFIYSENINATYVNASMQKNKWMLQAGLRAEHTHVNGHQVVTGSTFDRNYTNLFPSALAAYSVDNKNEISLSVSRRLSRPSYNQLNPFKFFLDPTTFKEGNPYLNPQYSWNFELTHTWMQKYSVQLGYSHTLDNIVTVLAPVEGQDRITVQTEKNLSSFDYYGISVYIPQTFLKIWQSVNTFNIYYGHYRGNLSNTNLSNGNISSNFNSQNTVQLPKGFSMEITGNLRTREIYGYMDVRPTGYLTAGIQKQLFEKRATLKLNVNDIFYTNRSRALTTFNTYAENFSVKRDTRVAVVTFTYRFGNSAMMTPQRKQSGAEEEKRRAGSSVG